MKTLDELKKSIGLQITKTGIDGGCGSLYLHGTKSKPATVVFSWGRGWKHVSVSYPNRCPTWDEMCAKERKAVMDLPNFDAEVFWEITGIKVDENITPKSCKQEG